MIAFLVLCYVAILATLVWLKVIKLNLWWKLSPLLFMLVCFFVLIFPLQWGAPSGTVNVYQYVIEITVLQRHDADCHVGSPGDR